VRHRPLFLSRLALRRRPLAYWTVAVLGAGLAAAVVGGLTARAESAAARYDGLRDVVVVVRSLAPGEELDAADVRVDRVPRAFVPAGAMTEVPEGETVVAATYPGEALLADRLAPAGRHGVAALLPEGTRAVAVPTGPAALALRVGDTVDVLATALDGATRVVARDVTVVDVGEVTATVAVSAGAAPAVATALTQATVTLVLTTG